MVKLLKPMLASSVDDYSQVQFPVYGSPKLDGFRAMVQGGRLVSRNLLPIPNRHTSELFGRAALEGLDGELIVGAPYGEGVFSRTSSGVTSVQGAPSVVYYVFDSLLQSGDYKARYHALVEQLSEMGRRGTSPPVVMMHQTLLTSAVELDAYVAARLAQGYEGVMLRTLTSPYKHGRSTVKEGYLLRIKPMEDSEALVFGCEEACANTNEEGNAGRRRTLKAGMVPKGTLGALLVRDVHTGVEFRLGTGTLTHAEAAALWVARTKLVGCVAKYKYQKIGTVAKPRLPIFLGWRHPSDMP